jgi:cobyrinic acid a,c-diamide synthase
MAINIPRIVIAGTHSGSGKTSLALALVSALTRRGLKVQTFKVGPDFLDPTYLAIASGRPCYNLDSWMAGREYVGGLFARASSDADIAVIEGVMGLFDGADPATSQGSTAEIAHWLDAPILLVVNAHGVARSLAALVKGYVEFDPDLRVVGVLANHCGSDRHRAWLSESLQSAALPPILAAIPRGAFPALRSRHLGLVTADHGNLPPSELSQLADVLERHASIEFIIQLARSAGKLPWDRPVSTGTVGLRKVAVGIAFDSAFHFYYPDNLDELASQGCELIRFSPLADDRLPENLDGLYFGGGYPEEHAEALSENRTMIESIRRFAANGSPVYGECGGLMYLAQGIEALSGKRYPLVGLLPNWTKMLNRLESLGYVEVTLTGDSLLGLRGTRLRGHEFHYSRLLGNPVDDPSWQTVYSLRRRRSESTTLEGFQRNRTLASYVHLHWASQHETIKHFIECCGGRV